LRLQRDLSGIAGRLISIVSKIRPALTPQNQPLVLANPNSWQKSENGMRSTLRHELCNGNLTSGTSMPLCRSPMIDDHLTLYLSRARGIAMPPAGVGDTRMTVLVR